MRIVIGKYHYGVMYCLQMSPDSVYTTTMDVLGYVGEQVSGKWSEQCKKLLGLVESP